MQTVKQLRNIMAAHEAALDELFSLDFKCDEQVRQTEITYHVASYRMCQEALKALEQAQAA